MPNCTCESCSTMRYSNEAEWTENRKLGCFAANMGGLITGLNIPPLTTGAPASSLVVPIFCTTVGVIFLIGFGIAIYIDADRSFYYYPWGQTIRNNNENTRLLGTVQPYSASMNTTIQSSISPTTVMYSQSSSQVNTYQKRYNTVINNPKFQEILKIQGVELLCKKCSTNVELSEALKHMSVIDPIDFELYDNPVVLPTGHTVDKRILEQLSEENGYKTCPITRTKFKANEHFPTNHAVKSLVASLIANLEQKLTPTIENNNVPSSIPMGGPGQT